MLWRILDASSLGDALIFQEVTPGQFKLSETQINQYEKWTYFVEEVWNWTAPPEKLKEEDEDFLQKARSKADLRQRFSPK